MHSKSVLMSLLITATSCMEHLANLEVETSEASGVHAPIYAPEKLAVLSHTSVPEFPDNPPSTIPEKLQSLAHTGNTYMKETTVVEDFQRNALQLEHLSKEQYSKLQKNWAENTEKVKRLAESSEEILNSQLEVNKQFHWMETYKSESQEHPNLSESRAIVELLIQKVSVLKQLKLLELGKLDPLMVTKLIREEKKDDSDIKDWIEHLLEIIVAPKTMKIWKQFFRSFLDEIKGLVVDEDDPLRCFEEEFNSEDYTIPTWSYVFKHINFLYRNGFINQEEFRQIFHDKKFAQQLVYYASHTLGDLNGPESVSKHWGWLSFNDSFEDLGPKDENILTYYSLVRKIQRLGVQLGLDQSYPDWETITKDLLSHNYIIELTSNDRKHSIKTKTVNSKNPSNYPYELKNDFANIVKLFEHIDSGKADVDNVETLSGKNDEDSRNLLHLNLENQTHLLTSVFQFIDFLEKRFAGNIIKHLGKTPEELKMFEYKKAFMLSFSRMSASIELTESYWYYLKNLEGNAICQGLSKLKKMKSELHDHEDEFLQLCFKANEDDKIFEWFTSHKVLYHFFRHSKLYKSYWSYHDELEKFISKSSEV
ncbi:hypothetical protein PGT21_024856 [Puccinia graminis f. sp. tritici]|uniref:Uncharacterized protein n=1 Tax=Puccinia graminis f. sp. tritici TaxID=56615 RepID=A0A5B0R817_PUCGR|nr:hypothetical protein PGT21_024856 [Puccinia graminis f. sp. tritici]KAA1120974.1 hypothetical protein PGTUg99_023845 [Puccinia graminis f. sp. tritici]